MLNSKTVNDEEQPKMQGRKLGKEQKTQQVKVKKEDAVEELNVGIFSRLKKKFSKKKFSVDNILKTEKIRSNPKEYVDEEVAVMAYYYSGGYFSGDRDYLSSKKIDFDNKEKLWEYAPQMLPCTKLNEIEEDETIEEGKKYLVKGTLEETDSKKFFGSVSLEAKDLNSV